MSNQTTASEDAEQIVEEAQSLLNATANLAEAKVAKARNRLSRALENSREVLAEVQERAIAGAKATDQTIRDHPYHAIGLALGLGALAGFLLGRRK